SSFVDATRVSHMRNGELEDIGEMSGFDTQTSTIVAGTLDTGGFLVQIHRAGIIIARPTVDDCTSSQGRGGPEVARWTLPQGYGITLAAMANERVVLSLARGNVVVLLKILSDEETRTASIVEIRRVNLDSEPSCIYYPVQPPRGQRDLLHRPVCIVGTYKPAILVLALDAEPLATLHEESLSSSSSLSAEGLNIPQSLQMLASPSQVLLLAASSRPTLSAPHVYNMGNVPMQLIPNLDARGDDAAHVIALSDRPWKIHFGRNGALDASPISFDQVSHAAPFRNDRDEEFYMFVTDRALHLARLDREKKNNVRAHRVTETPRRILHDKVTGRILVATVIKRGAATDSEIQVLDPDSWVSVLQFLPWRRNYELFNEAS
ncbi:hypothetical protein BDK51DRAFT_33618, partial [Blyttiomyces helicus]